MSYELVLLLQSIAYLSQAFVSDVRKDLHDLTAVSSQMVLDLCEANLLELELFRRIFW